MDQRRPIDKKRESGGRDNIGTGEDGAILEMYKLKGKLIFIKERALYEYMTADDVDPDRTNIDLPATIQKLLVNQGTESELVCRVFLTAKTLFRKEYFDSVDTEKSVTMSLNLLLELVALEGEINNYLQKEKEGIDEYERRRNAATSYALPSIPDIESRCKAIFQKADHALQILMEIISLFYVEDKFTKQSKIGDLQELTSKKYGEADGFAKFVNNIALFWNIIRELRNMLDHRLEWAKIQDFTLQPDGTVFSPTLEMNFKRATLERQALFHFLPLVQKNLTVIPESIFAHIARKNGKGYIFPSEVRFIPEEMRRFKHVRYCFWSQTPLGSEGFYNQ